MVEVFGFSLSQVEALKNRPVGLGNHIPDSIALES